MKVRYTTRVTTRDGRRSRADKEPRGASGVRHLSQFSLRPHVQPHIVQLQRYVDGAKERISQTSLDWAVRRYT